MASFKIMIMESATVSLPEATDPNGHEYDYIFEAKTGEIPSFVTVDTVNL
jgi:hypothetical protein